MKCKILAGLILAALLMHPATPVQAGGIEIDPVSLDGVAEPIREVIVAAQGHLQGAKAEGNTQQRSQAYALYGDVLLAHGFNDQAAQAYRNAQALAPTIVDWPYLLGVIEAGEGRLDQALAQFDQALTIDPYNRPSLARRGQLHLDRNDPDAAEKDFQRLLNMEPGMAVAKAGLGRAALAREDYETAAEMLEAALQSSPQATRLYRPLGMAYRGLGRVEEARVALDRAGNGEPAMRDPALDRVTEQSRSPQFFLEAALARADAGDLHAARELLINAVALDPEHLPALESYGEVAARQGDLDEARSTFRRMILLDPDSPRAYILLGQVDEMRGYPDEAISAYEQALGLDPELIEAHEGLAFAYLARGDVSDAEQRFESLAGQASAENESRYRYWQAKTMLARGDCDRAVVLLDLLREDSPGDSAVLTALARIRSSCMRADAAGLDEALSWAEAIYDANPDIEHAATLAMVQAARGEFDDAVDFQAQAMFQALRDGSLDDRDDLREDMKRYQESQRAERPFSPGYPPFGRGER